MHEASKEDNKTSFIFDFFNKEIDTAWNSLYEFFKQNFDEISQSSSHSISCPKFEDFEPNRINKIKKFFLNLWRIHEIVRDHTFKDRPKNK